MSSLEIQVSVMSCDNFFIEQCWSSHLRLVYILKEVRIPSEKCYYVHGWVMTSFFTQMAAFIRVWMPACLEFTGKSICIARMPDKTESLLPRDNCFNKQCWSVDLQQ